MTAILDTCILIKLLNADDEHHEWYVEELDKCKIDGPALITDIVYCEFGTGMESKEHVDAAISKLALERLPTNDVALFRAGVAFRRYRDENKGPKAGVLPDFLIGATAETLELPLITTNQKDFAKYFPKLKIVSP